MIFRPIITPDRALRNWRICQVVKFVRVSIMQCSGLPRSANDAECLVCPVPSSDQFRPSVLRIQPGAAFLPRRIHTVDRIRPCGPHAVVSRLASRSRSAGCPLSRPELARSGWRGRSKPGGCERIPAAIGTETAPPIDGVAHGERGDDRLAERSTPGVVDRSDE